MSSRTSLATSGSTFAPDGASLRRESAGLSDRRPRPRHLPDPVRESEFVASGAPVGSTSRSTQLRLRNRGGGADRATTRTPTAALPSAPRSSLMRTTPSRCARRWGFAGSRALRTSSRTAGDVASAPSSRQATAPRATGSDARSPSANTALRGSDLLLAIGCACATRGPRLGFTSARSSDAWCGAWLCSRGAVSSAATPVSGTALLRGSRSEQGGWMTPVGSLINTSTRHRAGSPASRPSVGSPLKG